MIGRNHSRTTLRVLSAALIACAWTSSGQDQQQLLDRIKSLEQRLAEVEGKTALVGTNALPTTSRPQNLPGEEKPETKIMEFFGRTHFSGYGSASYFHNFNRPS